MRDNLPGAAVKWRVADFESLARAMLDGQIDLALTYDLGLGAIFDRTIVGRVSPFAFAATSLNISSHRLTTLRDISEHRLILFDEGLSVRHVLGLFRKLDLLPIVAHRVRSLEVMRSLAANGEGVGISYTVPPGNLSYDRIELNTIRISDDFACEPIILARCNILPFSAVILNAEHIVEEFFLETAVE